MPRPTVALVFSKVGSVEGCGNAEELAGGPEEIEMHVVVWHVARCTGAEGLVGPAEDFEGGGAV